MVYHCCECGNQSTRRNPVDSKSKVCADCAKKNSSANNVPTERNAGETSHRNADPPMVSQDYWENMNKLLDQKFKSFEEKFKDNIMVEVKQITDPIQKEMKELKAENKKLKSEVTILKAAKEEHKEKFDKVEKTLKEHQKTLAHNDKDARMKRLLLSGMPEGEVELNGEKLNTDPEKVSKLLNIINPDGVGSVNVRRIGKKDQGPEARARYLIIEFANVSDRNVIKQKSSSLKDNEETQNFFLKADQPKKTREEYRRLHETKRRVLDENSERDVKIEYGKLLVDGVVVDQVDDSNQDFL